MIKRGRRHITDIAAALGAVLLLVALFSSCSAGRKASSASRSGYSYKAEIVSDVDSRSFFREMTLKADTSFVWESYSMVIYDTSRKDSTTGTYPVKAEINGTKQKNSTRVSASAMADTTIIHESIAESVRSSGESENEKASDTKTGTNTLSGMLLFVLVTGLLVAVPYAFRYVVKNIL